MPPEPQVGSQMRIPSRGSRSSTMSFTTMLGRVELAALLAGVVGELLDQVLVGAAEHVRLGEVGVAHSASRSAGPAGRGRRPGSGRRRAFARRCSRCRRGRPRAPVFLSSSADARLVERPRRCRSRSSGSRPSAPASGRRTGARRGPRGRRPSAERLALLLEAVREPLQEEEPEDVVLVVTVSIDPRRMSAADQR